MPATDEERLVVALEARINDFERNFKRANRTANDNFSSIEKRGKQSAANLEKAFGDVGGSVASKIEGMLKPFLAGGIITAGVGAAATALGEVAKTVAEVDREARKAGVSAKVWQQWAYVATATGMNIDGVTDALKELNIRGDEFAKTGKGSAQEAFQRLGYSATDVAQRLRDPSAFLDEISAKLQQMDAAAQTRILDEVFGGQGAEELAKALGLSVGEIQRLRSEAATFSDEQIEAAKKIDREFSTMWRNFSIYAKKAAIDGVSVASQIIDFINDPGGLISASRAEGERKIAAHNSPEQQLARLKAQRASIEQQIADTEANPFNVLKEYDLRQLRGALSAVDEQIQDLTGGSDEFKQALSELSDASNSLSGAFGGNVTAAANFKGALTELKNLVPELKAELDTLSTAGGIDAAYQRAVQSARTMGEVQSATDVANRAHASARVNYATKNTSNYLEGHLAEGRSKAAVDGMASAFATKLATMLASMPDNLRGQISINSGFRDVARQQELWLQALQKYGSVEAARKWVAPPGNSQHNKGNAADLGYGSDAARQWAHQNAGNYGLTFPLSNENWHIEDQDARSTANNAAMQQKIQLATQQANARRDLNMTIQEGLDLAQFEQSISGLSAQQQQIELAVYRAKMDAKRQGIELSQQEIDKIREQITATKQLDATNKNTAKSAEGMQQAQQFFAEGFTNALSGLIMGTTTLEGAMQQLANSILQAALQAVFLGQGPLAGLFGGGGGGGGLGGLFGALFAAKGGPVSRSRMTPLRLAGGGNVRGPGTATSDSIPAMLSDGEFVVNAAATKRHRAALEAINSGKAPALADGGIVGSGGLASAKSGSPIVMGDTHINIESKGSSGDPAKDAANNRDMAKQVANVMDQHMSDWVTNQMRPGGLLYSNR